MKAHSEIRRKLGRSCSCSILCRYALRDRARGAPINHSGFVSNLNASMKKSQARVLPGGRTQHHANAGLICSNDSILPRVPRGGDQACGVLSMQASLQRGDMSGYLCIGKSRKSGLGVRSSIPIEQHNRGIYDPGWTTSNITVYLYDKGNVYVSHSEKQTRPRFII